MDRLGLLGPGTLLAHGVWLDRAELELIAEKGATVVTNPVANQKLIVGRSFPWPDARRAGVEIGLGTDGPGSNDSLDPLADLKAFALIQREATGNAVAVPAGEAWMIATGQASGLLGGPGPLVPGRPADFALVGLGSPEMAVGDPISNLVYTATGAAVETLVVDGRVVSHSGATDQQEEVVERVQEICSRLFP
jgi:5-methylthioadenosine/S-adenosylhomocysteine deaminase